MPIQSCLLVVICVVTRTIVCVLWGVGEELVAGHDFEGAVHVVYKDVDILCGLREVVRCFLD